MNSATGATASWVPGWAPTVYYPAGYSPVVRTNPYFFSTTGNTPTGPKRGIEIY